MENKTVRYLGYAAGEIVLVVVGILIALWINDWNEDRKTRVFEQEILTQIRDNLSRDRENLHYIIGNAERAVHASARLLELQELNTSNDSVKYWLGSIVQFDRFQPLSNAYEVLKSRGLDLISNKVLRFQLGTYYDDQSYVISNANEDLKQTFVEDWLPIMKEDVVDFEFKQYLILKDEASFIASERMRNILVLNRSNYDGSIEYMEAGIFLIDEIIENINKEIQSK